MKAITRSTSREARRRIKFHFDRQPLPVPLFHLLPDASILRLGQLELNARSDKDVHVDGIGCTRCIFVVERNAQGQHCLDSARLFHSNRAPCPEIGPSTVPNRTTSTLVLLTL